VADIGVVIGQLARLFGDRLGDLGPAIADVDAVEPGEGVEQAIAVAVLDMAALPPVTIRSLGASPRACWARWVEGWKKFSRSQASSWSLVRKRCVPAQFQHQPLDSRRTLPVEQPADLCRAGERQGPDPRIGEPGLDHHRRLAGHHVEDARRQAGAQPQLTQRQARKRRLLGRMQEDRAAGGERRRRLPGDHRAGEIPGRDQCCDPHRLAPHLDFGIRQMRGDAFDVRPLRLLGVELDEARRIVDLALGLGERLALLDGHGQRQVVRVRDHQPVPRLQHGCAVLRQQRRPGRERGVGGVDGGRAFRARQRRHVGQMRAVGGVEDADRGAVGGRAPGAADISERAHKARIREGVETGVVFGCLRACAHGRLRAVDERSLGEAAQKVRLNCAGAGVKVSARRP
jgi:hypothetical protein